MANSAEVDKSIYYVPDSGWYPVFAGLWTDAHGHGSCGMVERRQCGWHR